MLRDDVTGYSWPGVEFGKELGKQGCVEGGVQYVWDDVRECRE